MLVFGHAGITLGVASVFIAITERIRLDKSSRDRNKKIVLHPHKEMQGSAHSTDSSNSWSIFRGRWLDVRFLLFGSLLPDLIDKPVGLFFFQKTFSNGRIFSHTLLFLLLVIMAGLLIYWRYRRTWIIALTPGVFTHLVLDGMWDMPTTLMWPLFGLSFERIDVSNWANNILNGLFEEPAIYIPEIIGVVIVSWFLYLLVRRKAVSIIIKYGRLTYSK